MMETSSDGYPTDNIVIRVLTVAPIKQALSYLSPQDVPVGTYLRVPLGGRVTDGVVWPGPAEPVAKMRLIAHIIDMPPMPAPLRSMIDWVSAYLMAPRGTVLRLSLPGDIRMAALGRRSTKPGTLVAAPDSAAKLSPRRKSQARVLAALADGQAMTAVDLAQQVDVSRALLRTMVGDSLLVHRPAEPDLPLAWPAKPDRRGVALSSYQDAALRALNEAGGRFDVSVLDGVTGSGKTEVYFEAISVCLRANRQALVLVPEIVLTSDWITRFHAAFGFVPVCWHSSTSRGERHRAWRAIAHGETPVVVGARSALFLPYARLGLVVVDEEHDQSYKQEDGVPYQTRDLAVLRGKLEDCPVILASATPSLETLVNIERGRYRAVTLPERAGGSARPEVAIIDLRADRPEPGHWLSPKLIQAITDNMAQRGQTLIFLNRRGYAPLMLCRACGHRLACPNCTAWLVEHRRAGRLICHHCAHSRAIPPQCPECDNEDGKLVSCGPGIERISAELREQFPTARLIEVTSDTMGRRDRIEQAIATILSGDVDLIIGTQMIAKGHHFPDLTLVGVIDADLGLAGGDLRAAERSWQLLHQVAGRAGRAQREGHVLLQSYAPNAPLLEAIVAQDRAAFIELEKRDRQRHHMPPFSRLAALIIAARDESDVIYWAREMARACPNAPGWRQGCDVFGPAEPPLSRLRGWHRRRFLVRARRDVMLQDRLKTWLAAVPLPRSIRLKIDIDPYSFL